MSLLRRSLAPTLVTLLLLGLASSLALAAETPEEVAELYYRLSHERRWQELAGLMDPSELETLKTMMVEMVSIMPENDPEKDQFLAMLLGPGVTQEALHDMDPAVMLANLLRFVSAMVAMRVEAYEVIGAVYETPELAHVVTRGTVSIYGGAFSMTALEIVSVVNTPEGWRVSSGGQIDSMVEMMMSMFDQMGQQVTIGGF